MYLQSLVAQTDKPLDVKLVCRDSIQLPLLFGNSLGLENHDFTALRRTKIVCEPVNEQMVTGADLQFHDVLALGVNMVGVEDQSGPDLERLLAVIGRKPDRLCMTADAYGLLEIKN